jgi:hypothetical protein
MSARRREVLALLGGGVRVAEPSAEGSVFEVTPPGKLRSAPRDAPAAASPRLAPTPRAEL